MEQQYIIIALIIILFIGIFMYHRSSENFVIVNNLTGLYTLEPKFDNSIQANRAITLQIVPQRSINPDYIDLIVHYANGKSKAVRTNLNVGNIYTYYNDYSNVQYLTDPRKIEYDLDSGTGSFRALTVVTENGQNTIKLMDYQISSRVN